MAEKPFRLFVVSLLLGWVIDILFWKSHLGVNFPIFTLLCLAAGFYLMISSAYRPHPRSLWLIAPIVFFGVVTITRQEPLTRFLAFFFSLFSMALMASSFLGGRWIEFGFRDYFRNFGRLIKSMLVRMSRFIQLIRSNYPESARGPASIPLAAVVRGLLIAVPILFFFSRLLSSADVVFGRALEDFFALFAFDNLSEFLYRLLKTLFWAYIFSGILLHTEAASRNKHLIGEDRPFINRFLGITEASIILASVTVLFAIFVIIQFQYFFGGMLNIDIEGLTYSQYARRGFSELNTVAFFSLLLILSLNTLTHRDTEKERWLFSGLNIALLSQVLIILVSSYQRLMLAIGWHGYSRLRVYPKIFMIWMGVLLVTIVVLEIFRRERFFAFAALMASMGFAATLAVIDVDAAIVNRNVDRALEGKHFNYHYLADLSADAVPALAKRFSDNSLDATTRTGVGIALMCYQYSLRLNAEADLDWRAFNLPTWKALRAFEDLEEELDGYSFNDRELPLRVKAPDDVAYLCPGGPID